MTRWLFIFLAVVLGCFPPTNAHALTRASQAAYDTRPPVEIIVFVAGITMDTSEGDQEDPLSLHKYIYGEGNPVDNSDPSGNDIGDLLAVADIGSTLDALPTAPPLAAIPIHRIRKVTVQSYIGAAVAWGFKGDNHGPTEHPSNHYRTTSTITFDEGNPSAPARVESKTGVTVKVATGEKGLASAKGLTGSMNRDDTGDINISMVGDAKNPLIFPQSATPPIHYDLRLSLIYRWKHYQGAIRHSLFPSFQVFIDNKRVFSYTEQGSPMNLFNFGDGDLGGDLDP